MADAEAAQQDPIASANDRLRDASKWLIAASAGVGAVLIAGSQLSSIGKLDLCRPTSSVSCARLPVAALGAVVALAGVVIAIWAAVKILVPIVVPLRVLQTHWDDSNRKWADAEFFRANTEYLGSYNTPIAIERARKESYEQLEAAQQELAGAADDADRKIKQANVDAKKAKFEELQEAAGTVSSIAQHELLKAEFNKVLGRLLWAAVVTALVSPPSPGQQIRLRDPSLGRSYVMLISMTLGSAMWISMGPILLVRT